MQTAVINVNGQLFAPETREELLSQAHVSVYDRGYLYGDSLYEVCRTYNGKMFLMDGHLKRLSKSADLCQLVLGQNLEHYAAEMERTLLAFHARNAKMSEAYVRIIVSRGIGKIGFGLSCLESPSQYVVIVQPLDEPSAAQLEQGYAMQISSRLRNDPRALDPAMKSGNYLNSLLAYLEAAREDYDDAILCNAEGHVTEGTTFNVGYIRRGILATPPLDIGILDGLTRRMLLDVAASLGVPVREVRFPKERFYEADEVFMCSTIKEIFPVTRVDNHLIAGGKPGALTLKLRRAFRKAALERSQ